jgi:hypothetical protein
VDEDCLLASDPEDIQLSQVNANLEFGCLNVWLLMCCYPKIIPLIQRLTTGSHIDRV